jgi:hypothetical protein
VGEALGSGTAFRRQGLRRRPPLPPEGSGPGADLVTPAPHQPSPAFNPAARRLRSSADFSFALFHFPLNRSGRTKTKGLRIRSIGEGRIRTLPHGARLCRRPAAGAAQRGQSEFAVCRRAFPHAAAGRGRHSRAPTKLGSRAVPGWALGDGRWLAKLDEAGFERISR